MRALSRMLLLTPASTLLSPLFFRGTNNTAIIRSSGPVLFWLERSARGVCFHSNAPTYYHTYPDHGGTLHRSVWAIRHDALGTGALRPERKEYIVGRLASLHFGCTLCRRCVHLLRCDHNNKRVYGILGSKLFIPRRYKLPSYYRTLGIV